jgi:hypothetical protein
MIIYTSIFWYLIYRCDHAMIIYGYFLFTFTCEGPSWLWSNGSWIYNYLCNQCLSQLMLCVRIPLMARCARYNIMWSSLIVTCDSRGFSTGTTVFSINKPDRHDITEILLKVALSTITLTLTPLNCAVGSLINTKIIHFECCSCNLYDQSLSVNYQRSIVLLYLIASVQCINIDESGQINYLDKVEQINLCIAHSFRGVLLIIFCIIFIKDSVLYPIETYLSQTLFYNILEPCS